MSFKFVHHFATLLNFFIIILRLFFLSFPKGHGGNIYSFRGAFGEAVPPQHHESAPFIDEIPQMVVTDHTKIKTPDTPFFFIHQAGTYMKDKPYTDLPFYSPNVAKFCRYNTCAFASWGQQAPLTTYYRSHALYYTMYTGEFCLNFFIF